MDSLEWSKKYEVLSFSRLTLSSRGFTNEQIASLTQEDLEHIADVLHTASGVIDQNVEAAEVSDRCFNDLGAVVLFGHVGQHDRRTVRVQPPCGRLPEPR